MDQYFQREGRDWERYAWLKARAVAGDIAAGEAWLQTLRPFVYRRYLDSPRSMACANEGGDHRRGRAPRVARGHQAWRRWHPRIEFLCQALQLIRGGREPALRERRLLVALDALVAAGQIAPEDGSALREAYLFLRRLENRLQMLRDAQTHVLPSDALDRERIAVGLGYADWDVLRAALAEQQQRVSTEFAALLAPRKGQAAPDALANYWRSCPKAATHHCWPKPASSMPTAPTSHCAISPRAPA